MDAATRERLDRKYRPHLFERCSACGEESVRLPGHVCDPVRRETYFASFAPVDEPNEEMVDELEKRLLSVLMKHRIVVSSPQLRDLALAVEPATRGPEG